MTTRAVPPPQQQDVEARISESVARGEGYPDGPRWSRSGTPFRRAVNVLWGTLFVLFLIVLASAFYIGQKAMTAGQALTRARSDLASFQQLTQGAPGTGPLSLAHAATASMRDIDDAVSASNTPLWPLYEHAPILGPNLRVIRESAAALRPLMVDGVVPLASALDTSAAPRSVAAPASLLPDRTLDAVQRLDKAVAAAALKVGRIDVDRPLPQFARPVVQLRTELQAAARTTASWRTGGAVLRRALGESSARQYLLVLARPSKPDLFMLVGLDRGRVTSRSVSSEELGRGAPHSVSASSARRLPQVASSLARAWRTNHRAALDGVVLADAGLLSTILQATGPVRMPHAPSISAKTGLATLRSSPTRFARSALPVVLGAVYAGRGNVAKLLARLPDSAGEGAMRMWASDIGVERAVRSTRLDGSPVAKD